MGSGERLDGGDEAVRGAVLGQPPSDHHLFALAAQPPVQRAQLRVLQLCVIVDVLWRCSAASTWPNPQGRLCGVVVLASVTTVRGQGRRHLG